MVLAPVWRPATLLSKTGTILPRRGKMSLGSQPRSLRPPLLEERFAESRPSLALLEILQNIRFQY